MNATIQGIIDHMFKDTVDNTETRALHEELLNNCQEHYSDLIARGMSETEAIDAVVESLRGMKEVIDEYPKKAGTGEPEKESVCESVPEVQAENNTQDAPPVKKPSEYTYDPALVSGLKTDLKSSDLKIGVSSDDHIHVRCEDMEQLLCQLDGSTLSVRIDDNTKKSIEEAGQKLNSQEFSMKGLLNFIGKAISSVASNIAVSWNVYIDLPAVALAEMDLNAKSGDIEVKAKMPEILSAHSMSGEVNVNAVGNDPATKVIISTMSGDAEFYGNAKKIQISSMSGDVEASGIFQEAELKSTSGEADLEGEAIQVRISSVSGDVSAELRNPSVRSIQASSTSGDVDIDLPDGMESVHTSMKSVSGSTRCSIPDSGSGAELQIQASSVSGDVTVQ